MTPMERLGALSHARTGGFWRRLESARETVTRWLCEAGRPYVAFSGGKDSTVLLHLVRSIAPETPAMWSDDEYNLPETMDLLNATPDLHRIAARVEHAAWFTSWADGPESVPDGTEWQEGGDGARAWEARHGYDGAAVGIRADENSYRQMNLKTHGILFRDRRRVWQCRPLAWWSVMDIWAYIAAFDVPYNRAYDRLSEIGVPLARQRVGPFANRRALPMGQMAILRAGWPGEYARFMAAHPEAARET